MNSRSTHKLAFPKSIDRAHRWVWIKRALTGIGHGLRPSCTWNLTLSIHRALNSALVGASSCSHKTIAWWAGSEEHTFECHRIFVIKSYVLQPRLSRYTKWRCSHGSTNVYFWKNIAFWVLFTHSLTTNFHTISVESAKHIRAETHKQIKDREHALQKQCWKQKTYVARGAQTMEGLAVSPNHDFTGRRSQWKHGAHQRFSRAENFSIVGQVSSMSTTKHVFKLCSLLHMSLESSGPSWHAQN